MTVFVNDTFTDSDGTLLDSHTGETGASWTEHATASTVNMEIRSNHVESENTGSGASAYYASGAPSSAEYDIEADITKKFNSTNGGVGLLGRVSTSAVTYYNGRYNDNSGIRDWELYKLVSGSATLLGSYGQSITIDQVYALKLEIRDANKKVFVDSVQRITSTDNAITAAGKAGLRIYTGATGDQDWVHVDNYVATDLSVATGQPRNLRNITTPHTRQWTSNIN